MTSSKVPVHHRERGNKAVAKVRGGTPTPPPKKNQCFEVIFYDHLTLYCNKMVNDSIKHYLPSGSQSVIVVSSRVESTGPIWDQNQKEWVNHLVFR